MDEQEKNTEQQEQEKPGKTFTQEEVNRIVSDRLARDRDKRTAELDEREKAVKARELAMTAAEKLAAAGLPKELSGVLRYEDEATLEEAISTLSHLRGFGNGNDTSKKEGKKTILENRLEESDYDLSDDTQIKAAFQPPKTNF